MEKNDKNILIVEDEVITALLLQQQIKSWNYSSIDHVTNGKDALIIAEDKKPLFIVMDIRLAGEMDGVEAAMQIIKKYTPKHSFFS